MAHLYVDLPQDGKSVYLHSYNPTSKKFKREKQVLWGDWLRVDDDHDFGDMESGWVAIIWAPRSAAKTTYYIPEAHTTRKRPLEIIFLDVGQGDGAVLISPETGANEKIMVIDAGEGDNMKRFLNGRFKAYRGFDFEAAIITHPDMDHYLGFEEIFEDHRIGFDTIYQNGLVERPVRGTFAKLGGVTKDETTGESYLTQLAINTDDVEREFSDDSNFGRMKFPRIMHHALHNPKIKEIKMLSTDPTQSIHVEGRAYMPGFAPAAGKDYSIEVLGPVAEHDGDGNIRLRRISSNYGKTKNGHSVILRLHYGMYRVLFGGDLNVPAEKYLLQHYTKQDRFPRKNTDAHWEMMTKAKYWFESEIMKVCHHGSEKVTDEFMQVVNPACFVISSGDQEGHVHPRPDLLGRLGKFGRGESPVLLSTELQRSTREKEDMGQVKRLQQDVDKLAKEPDNEDLKKAIQKSIRALGRTNVDVYGAIYLKTDGERLITAFKFEEASDKKKWFYFEYLIDERGRLELR